MKAVILSGGRGTRLSPLTDKKPKPLVSVGGTPIIKTIIKTLSDNGFDSVAVTLGYRGDDIRKALGESLYGVKITYFEESSPLGTAGGVKNCESFIDSDFLVLSGDALFSFDIQSALHAHRASKDIATVLVTPCEEVLEYGVVLLDDGGKVSGFSEKPSWEGVKSDLVNCGIYFFKKEILDYIPKNTPWDFSKNLFPALMSKKIPINAFIAQGFWCDVGNPWALWSCNMKTLSHGFFLGYTPSRLQIHKSAQVKESVIGSGTLIKKDCEIKRSVVGEDCVIDEEAELVGCILGDRVKIGKGVRVERGAVIGDDSVISEGRLVGEGKRLSADTKLEEDDVCRSFSSGCVLLPNGSFLLSPCNPEDFFAMGRSSVLLSKKIGIIHDSNDISWLAANTFAMGTSFSGGEAVMAGEGKKASAALVARKLGIPFFYLENSSKGVIVSAFSKASFPLTGQEERRLLQGFERPPEADVGQVSYFDGAHLLERSTLLDILGQPTLSPDNLTVKDNGEGRLISSLTGCTVSEEKTGDFFIDISPTRQRISLKYGKRALDTSHIHALILKYLAGNGQKVFSLPSSAPLAFDSLAENSGSKIIRVQKGTPVPTELPCDLWALDSLVAAAFLYKIILDHGFSLESFSRTADSLPCFLCVDREINIGERSVGEIMRSLEKNPDASSLTDGISISKKGGSVRITPRSRNVLRLIAEAQSAEIAEELCGFAENIIKET